ncbi:hypothetical protein SAMN05421739_11826 [Pontibacter chinhatensis]|uniref:Uncharacterized protein n=1 Tax=Pontibacter chinhatensis TaxID=1436961 RepID=A0A1I2ZSQ7_9BACT|nr:hypothetical protein SAMN05421739_11826 [Pontibacter chinhatensis]
MYIHILYIQITSKHYESVLNFAVRQQNFYKQTIKRVTTCIEKIWQMMPSS